ncbi:nicotinate-nucleotide adenylyltransferase [Rhizobiales bacterium L72]|uniref:Probable nicotinate-nucleotide adenylyltransferase n=1 Tax=Propylenella binzhouense TaxID=2555902 RepID=A0A964T684_9HYPH|nr:nicotinate-nucleotide adenylyltransferase [Propylenella binzhouense]
MRVGLYGGSFNPAHAGHRHVSLLALRRLSLDQVWWLVTPGNPLKMTGGLPPQRERMAQAAAVARHPRIAVTGLEAEIGTRFTADLVAWLAERLPLVRFVWIMGSDNLCQFDRWERFEAIAGTVPLAVVNRPGSLAAPLAARAAHRLARWRIPEAESHVLADLAPPAWVYLTGPRTRLSSTAVRSSTSPPRIVAS